MLVVFGFVILILSFIIAFFSLISEEKKQRHTVLVHPAPENPHPNVSKEEIVKMAANSPVFPQTPKDEEVLPEPKQEDTLVVKKVVDQAFPWEEDDVLPQEKLPDPEPLAQQTKNRDSLFGEFKIPRKEE